MKAITKLPCLALVQEHANPPGTPMQARDRWGNFRGKGLLKTSLLHEQYQLCCYSEVRADALAIAIGHHIEHVENKSQNPQRTFDYSNLAASAFSNADLAKFHKDDVFGGHAIGKQTSVDMSRFIACHLSNCADFFRYLEDGRIVPNARLDTVKRDRAQYTIDVLNLNSPFLEAQRKAWWAELDEALQGCELDKDCISRLAESYVVPSQNFLKQFFSLARQFFGRHAEQALQTHAPELV